MMKVAVFAPDGDERAALTGLITRGGFDCTGFSSARQLLAALRAGAFDLFLIDWTRPDLGLIADIRAVTGGQPPILLLAGANTEADLVAGLRAGADDLVARPQGEALLLARLEAMARRARADAAQRAETWGPYVFELGSRTARAGERPARLTPKEFSLALYFFRNLNRMVTRQSLFETIWGADPSLPTRTLDIHVSKLRSKLKLGEQSRYRLRSIYGEGYRLEETPG